jgi:hypothetical protein
VNALFEELDLNHSQSISRDEWIAFRINKNLALVQGLGRGFKPRKSNSVHNDSHNPWHAIIEVQNESCKPSRTSSSTFIRTSSATFTAPVKNPAKLAMGIKKVLATTHATRQFVCAGEKVEARSQGSTTHLAPSAIASASERACKTTCPAVAPQEVKSGGKDDVWNETFTLLLTGNYNACFNLIRMRRDELVPKVNETDIDKNTLLHACALSLNPDPNTVEDDGAPKIMPAALPRIIKYLLDMGIEIQKNSEGQTPADALKTNGINQREINEVFRTGAQLDEDDNEDIEGLFPLRSESSVSVPALKTVLRKGQARRPSLGTLCENQPSRHVPPVSVAQSLDLARDA